MVDIAKHSAEHIQAPINKYSAIADTLSKTPEDGDEISRDCNWPNEIELAQQRGCSR